MIFKAREHFRSAELLLSNGQFRDAASRAYYTIYSAIFAVVGYPTQKDYWTHQGIRKAIVKLLHEEGQDDISKRVDEDIKSVYRTRLVADYQAGLISEETAREAINKARNILNWAERRVIG